MEDLIAKRIKLEKERLQSYLDLSGVLMVTLDKNGDIILINKKLQDVLGYKVGELIGKNWCKTCIPQNAREGVDKTFKGLIKGELEANQYYVNPILTKDGKERIVSWHNSILYDEDKTIVGILGAGEDITDLITAEKKYRDLYEEAPLAYFSLGKDEFIKQCNKASELLLGYSKNELLNKNLYELFAKTAEGIPKAKRIFKNLLEGGKIQENELQMREKSGKNIWVSLSANNIMDNSGNIIESRVMIQNINKRKDMENELKNLTRKLEDLVNIRTMELKQSEEKYRLISENANDLIAVLNNKYEFEYINEETSIKITGYKNEDLIGKKVWDIMHPDDHAKLNDIYKMTEKGFDLINEEFKIKFRLKTKHRNYIWVESVNKVFTGTNGEAKIIAITRDFTRKKEAEDRLKKSEKEKAIILDNISEHIIFQDLDHNIIWLNKAAADLLNKKPSELVGEKCYSLWYDREERCENCPVKKAIETGLESSSQITSANGKIWNIKGFPVKNDEGKIFGAVEVSFDVTLQKQSEDRYREAYNQANLYKDLIAHDMNNILQNIRSSIELSTYYLNEPKNIEGIRELHHIIEEQVARGANLVANVHKLSEIEKYKITLNRIDPIKILEERIEYILNSYPNEEINIRKDYLEAAVKVYGNDLLMDVFENIIINAIKHNQHPVKLIQIRMSKEENNGGSWVKFEFVDNGIGISDKDKEKIFKGLYKSKIGGGMGVGLSLVKKVIENHDGKIWVENRIENDHTKGSNFVILLKEA